MIIINKDGTAISNFKNIENIFIGFGTSIKVNYSSGKGASLGVYNSEVETKIAMEILIDKMNKSECVKLPSDKEIQARVANMCDNKQRSFTGKKSKGHGGS